ncbi:PepSY-associated TM helix domain-containing protein [Paraflavitalea pollutisoli]|uniref:PepSY-associated TM helix domain-containing protein n=1 Tax=Paraflavitalea pollutisoli TaxID=3034143 RepID=UPI0023EC369F|nr:PepSY-associated TM helix domain-containing protein [Paraflavitalea sp. H1-2-19X]
MLRKTDSVSGKKKAGKDSKGLAKKLAGWLHLWLGLASGLVIVVVALTGAIYAWQPELSEALYDHLHVQPQEKPLAPLSQLKATAEAEMPGKKPTRISFAGRDHSVAVSFNNAKAGYYYIVYLNPYSGEVIRVQNMDREFFRQVLNGHMHLWLPDPYGAGIIAAASLIFLVIIITGLIMWWPRKWTKAIRQQSFKVKLNASPKRLNYDLHNVLGFYASWVMLFTVLTGLVWAFDSVRDAEYWLFSGGKSFPAPDKVKSVKPEQALADNPLDKIAAQMVVRYPDAGKLQYQLPPAATGVITVRMFPETKRFYNADYLSFDQYTGIEIPNGPRGPYATANGGDRANRLTFDIHTGMIGGVPLRLVVFLAALVTASLPITGFYIWWGKKKKQRKPALKAVRSVRLPQSAELAN